MNCAVHIAILAGGKSERMGVDKATLPMGSGTLLAHIASHAAETGSAVLVVGRESPVGWPLPSVRFLPDQVAGRGPLGGLLAALAHAGEPVLAIACDMPRLTTAALAWLIDQAGARPLESGLAVRNEGLVEPLFSVYMPSLIPTIEARIDTGRLSLNGLIADSGFDYVDAPADVVPALLNVNSMAEWVSLDL